MAKKTKREELIDLAHEYQQTHAVEVINLDDVSKWAVSTGRYKRSFRSEQQNCKEDLARALRSERHIDPQGRTVRTMHAIRIVSGLKPLYEWEDLRIARPDRIEIAFSQRRTGIYADVVRHKEDLDSYNENNIYGATLEQFSYNFDLDIEESQLPTEYLEDEEFEEAVELT
jgi:hypothetical protein